MKRLLPNLSTVFLMALCPICLGLPQQGQSQIQDQSTTETVMKSIALPDLPVGITSFGGAVVGESLYVYGGHCGNSHEYYKSGQNSKLMQLNLKAPQKWTTVCDSSGCQGLAMVQYKGGLYRVGGFEARNTEDEDQDLHSISDFSKFNFETKKWTDLTPLPSPRSSLDAVVIGDTLFVVGGWNIRGDKGSEWCTDAVSIDLSNADSKWQTMELPFRRRAISTGYVGDKLYVVGGMQENGGPTKKVQIYDKKSKTWSDGPELPGSEDMEGFGSSCFNIGGKLIVSTYSGKVLQLNDSGDAWAKIHELDPGRFFHRVLPFSHNKFMLVGGANMEIGKLLDIPILKVN